MLSGLVREACANQRYAFGKSFGTQWPVAYIVPSRVRARMLSRPAAERSELRARSQFCGTPRPYKYFSALVTRVSSGVTGGAAGRVALGFGERAGFSAGGVSMSGVSSGAAGFSALASV